MERFRYFLVADHSSRYHAMGVSATLGFAWGILSEKVIGCSFQTAAYQVVCIVGLAYLFQIWRYCVTAHEKVSVEEPSFTRRVLLQLPSAAILLLLNLVPLSTLEAAALDRKLRKMISSSPLDQKTILEITRALVHAQDYNVRPSTNTITAVQSVLMQTSQREPRLSQAAATAASAAASVSTVNISLPSDMYGPMFGSLPEAKGSKWEFVPIATNTGPDNYATIGIARKPDIAEMVPLNKQLPEFSDYGPAFLLVKGLTAILDGYRLKHVVFQNMNLIYDGGAIILDDVYFFKCRFQFRSNENSWALMASVTAGGWVKFSAI